MEKDYGFATHNLSIEPWRPLGFASSLLDSSDARPSCRLQPLSTRPSMRIRRLSLCPQRWPTSIRRLHARQPACTPSSLRSAVGRRTELEDFIDHSLLRQDDGRTARLQRHRLRTNPGQRCTCKRLSQGKWCPGAVQNSAAESDQLCPLPSFLESLRWVDRANEWNKCDSEDLRFKSHLRCDCYLKTAMSPRSNSKYTSVHNSGLEAMCGSKHGHGFQSEDAESRRSIGTDCSAYRELLSEETGKSPAAASRKRPPSQCLVSVKPM